MLDKGIEIINLQVQNAEMFKWVAFNNCKIIFLNNGGAVLSCKIFSRNF